MNKYRVVFHLDEPSQGRADQVFIILSLVIARF
jgi:hypothetical protein